MSDEADIVGRCDCGAVEWTYRGKPSSATACSCTICRRYGVLWMYGAMGETIDLSGPTSGYLRGDKEIEFLFCATCGCTMAWRALAADTDGRILASVNARMAQPEQVADIRVRHFDGLNWKSGPVDERTVGDMWY